MFNVGDTFKVVTPLDVNFNTPLPIDTCIKILGLIRYTGKVNYHVMISNYYPASFEMELTEADLTNCCVLTNTSKKATLTTQPNLGDQYIVNQSFVDLHGVTLDSQDKIMIQSIAPNTQTARVSIHGMYSFFDVTFYDLTAYCSPITHSQAATAVNTITGLGAFISPATQAAMANILAPGFKALSNEIERELFSGTDCPIVKKKCECGVDSVGGGRHSMWCPKHGGV